MATKTANKQKAYTQAALCKRVAELVREKLQEEGTPMTRIGVDNNAPIKTSTLSNLSNGQGSLITIRKVCQWLGKPMPKAQYVAKF